MQGTTDPDRLAQVKDTARFDFTAAARKAFKDYPRLRETVAFLDLAAPEKALYHHPFFEAHLRQARLEPRNPLGVALDNLLGKDFAYDYVRDFKRIGPHVRGLLNERSLFKLMCVSTTSNPAASRDYIFDIKDPHVAQQLQRFTFQHELGHMVLPLEPEVRCVFAAGYKNDAAIRNPLEENAADAFMALSELQRDPSNRHLIDRYSLGRALSAIDSDIHHFATVTLDAILQKAPRDLSAFTPQQIADTAKNYAEKFSPSMGAAAEMHYHFDRLYGYLRSISPRRLRAFETIAETITQRDIDPFVVYTGARVLHAFLKPGGETVRNERIQLEGPFWEGMKPKISAALARIPDGHVLRELDLNRVDTLGLQTKEGPPAAMHQKRPSPFR